MPDVDQSIAEAGGTTSGKPGVVGAHGPLTVSQSSQLLSGIADDAGQDVLLHHLAIEQAIAGTPLTAGNRTRLLQDGEATFAAVFEAIRAAKHHVNLEYYTLEDVVSEDERLSDLLIAKRGEGISVNVIYDSYGSSETPAEFFERLTAAGVNVSSFTLSILWTPWRGAIRPTTAITARS